MIPRVLIIIAPLEGEVEKALALLGPPDGPPVPLPHPARALPYRVNGERVIAGFTGMGAEATRRALEALAREAPRAVVHLGCAGGLAPGVKTGDALRCDRLLREGHETLELPATAGLSLPRGASLTVDRVVTSAEEKRALFERTGAQVVEMESWHAASTARALGLELTCVRAVVDAHDEVLPDLTRALDEVGRPRPLRFISTLARNPRAIAALPRLARTFGEAQAALARVVAQLLAR
jgi:adenosylhomocysteine nucleosidase